MWSKIISFLIWIIVWLLAIFWYQKFFVEDDSTNDWKLNFQEFQWKSWTWTWDFSGSWTIREPGFNWNQNELDSWSIENPIIENDNNEEENKDFSTLGE